MNTNICSIDDSLGVDIKLIDGVPQWSARGADSFSPFKAKTTITPSNFFVNGVFGDGANYFKINLQNNTFSIQNNAIRVIGNSGQSGLCFLFYLDGTYKTLKYKASCNISTRTYLVDCKDGSYTTQWDGSSFDISYDISQLRGMFILQDGCANNERNGYIYEIQLL